MAERCERPIGKLTTLCTSAWQPQERSIVMRVSMPSASIFGAHSACCTRWPAISSPRGHVRLRERAGVEHLTGMILEVLLVGRPGRAHDRLAVEQEGDAPRQRAVRAVVP